MTYDLLSAKKLEEALDYLDKFSEAKILAGGTDLLVNIHKKSPRLPQFKVMINISQVSELKFVTRFNNFVEIGSLVTHADLINVPLVKNNFPILVAAAQLIGSVQIRNRGTIGGNIVNASPAADLLPPLIALKAEVELVSKKEKRILSIEKFLSGPYQTKLHPGEILTKIRIPILGSGYYANFQKIGRRKALSIARLNLAVVTKIGQGNIFQDTRVVPGSATPYPQSLPETERGINGQSISDINLEKMGKLISQEMVSITGERWSTPYKKPVIATLFGRAMEKIIQEVRANE